MTKQVIKLKDEELFVRFYKVQRSAKDRHSIQTTVPMERLSVRTESIKRPLGSPEEA